MTKRFNQINSQIIVNLTRLKRAAGQYKLVITEEHRSVDTLPLFRAAHLLPHLELLRMIGAPVENELKRAKLPVNIGDQFDILLPLHCALDFLTRMTYREAIEDFELQAVHNLKLEHLSSHLVEAIYLTPTLYSALKTFCEL